MNFLLFIYCILKQRVIMESTKAPTGETIDMNSGTRLLNAQTSRSTKPGDARACLR